MTDEQPLRQVPSRTEVLTMPFEAEWYGPLSRADSIPRLWASRVARALRRRHDAVWPGALRLTKSAARLWRRGSDVSAATSAQTIPALFQCPSLTQPRVADDLDIAVRYQPAEPEAERGGDWYDAFVYSSGATFLTVGDVTGHDHHASVMMGQVLTLLRGLACDADDAPSRLLSRLDAAMEGLPVETLASAVVARVEPLASRASGGAQRVHWSSAGHVPPLLRGPDGVVTRLDVEPDLLLGICRHTPRVDHVIDLEAGSTLLLYTDGLVEHRDIDLDDGIDNLAALLADLGDLDPDPLCEAIIEAAPAFDARDDDIALLVLRVSG